MAEGFRSFGSYILFKQLSVDALGHLYRAGELGARGLSRVVFLRTFDGISAGRGEIAAYFEAARQIADVLQAANVARGPGYLSAEDVPAAVCDYVPGQALSTVLDRTRSEDFPVPVDNALLVAEKLALALTAALAVELDGSPIVHGFLHPGMIVLTNDGEALVTGFGLAEGLLAALDRPETAPAIASYLAPEVLESRTTSKRGDVYSLGAILFELLSGQPLPVETQAGSRRLEDLQLAYVERPLPEDIKGVLSRALAARPQDRYSSSVDLRKELERLLYGGAYSPTTFNLALFMDRLFRAEIDGEERERELERNLDLAPYRPQLPELRTVGREEATATSPRRLRRGLTVGLAGLAVAAAVAASTAWLLHVERLPWQANQPPTPSAQELQAQRDREERRLQAMVQQLVQEKMAEREEDIRQELMARQTRIEELQRRLRESEQRAATHQPTRDEEEARRELERQIAEELEAQQARQAELVADTDSTIPSEEEPTTEATVPQPVAAPPTEPPPTPLPRITPSPTRPTIERGTFLDPSQVDTLPVLLKEHPVEWPRLAHRSRREGLVILRATVDADGRVTEVTVLRADDESYGIPDAVSEAVRHYYFKPATKDGVPVTSYATVTKRYRFTGR